MIIFAFGFRQPVDIFLGYLNYILEFDSTFRYYVITGLGEIFLGLYLVRRGAPLIVDYAYPDDDDEEIEDVADVLPETVKDELEDFDVQGKI